MLVRLPTPAYEHEGQVVDRARNKQRARRTREGAAALEMALVLPLLVLLLLGIIDFGHLMFVVNTMNNAAREGARRGAVESDATQIASVASDTANTYLSAARLGPGSCRSNCPDVNATYHAAAGGVQASVEVTVSLGAFHNITGFTYRVLPGLTNPFEAIGRINTVSRMRWELSP